MNKKTIYNLLRYSCNRKGSLIFEKPAVMMTVNDWTVNEPNESWFLVCHAWDSEQIGIEAVRVRCKTVAPTKRSFSMMGDDISTRNWSTTTRLLCAFLHSLVDASVNEKFLGEFQKTKFDPTSLHQIVRLFWKDDIACIMQVLKEVLRFRHGGMVRLD